MPRTKRKVTAVTLSSENKIIFPLLMSESGITPSVIGNRVVISILRQIEDSFRELLTNRRKYGEWNPESIFGSESMMANVKGDNIYFQIRLDDVVENKREYQFAFNAICKISDLKFWIPCEYKNDGSVSKYVRIPLFAVTQDADRLTSFKWKPLRKAGEELIRSIEGANTRSLEDGWFETCTTFNNYNKLKDNTLILKVDTDSINFRYRPTDIPSVEISIPRFVSDWMFDLQKQYGYIVDRTSIMSQNKYFGAIYNYVASHQDNRSDVKELSMDYDRFRTHVCGLDVLDESENMYENTYDFERRILKPCMDEMKDLAEQNMSDCWFEYAFVYGKDGKARRPKEIKLTVYRSVVGKELNRKRKSNREDIRIENRLIREFNQTAQQAYHIVKSIDDCFKRKFENKLDELIAYMNDGRLQIPKDSRSYFNKAFCNFIDSCDREKRRNPQMAIVFEENKKIIESAKEESRSSLSNDKWPAFIEAIHVAYGDQENASWIDAMRFAEQTPRTLTIAIPSLTYKEMFIDPNIDIMQSSANTVYGCKMSLKFKA